MKKILALALALVMLLSVLAGCDTDKPVETKPNETQGNQPKETNAPTETEDPGIVFPLAETLEVSVMMAMGNSAYSFNDNLVMKRLQENANIKFNITEFDGGEAKEKMNLLLSSGEYPELLLKSTTVDFDKYGADGILIPLEELIREYAPNLTAVLDELNGWSNIKSPDGHIYSIPFIGRTREYGQGGMRLWINQKWLDAVGKEMPTNKEEFYEVLKAFKEGDPNGNGVADEIPFVPQAGSQIASIIGLINIFGDSGLWMNNYFTVQDGEMVYLPTTEYFKEDWLKYMKKLYDEGLMHPDAFTLKMADVKALNTSNTDTVGIYYCSEPTGHFEDLDRSQEWVTLKPFNPETFSLDAGIATKCMGITDKCANPEILVAWADQLFTEEGGRMIRLGLEGETYVVNDDGTFTKFEDQYENYTYQCTVLGGNSMPFKEPDLYFEGLSDPDGIFANDQLYNDEYGVCVNGVVMPTLVYAQDVVEERSALYTDINSYVRNYVAEAVTGVIEIDATWEEFQNTLKQMDVERMVEIYNDTYQAAIGG